MNDQLNLEHPPLGDVYICVYNSTTRMRSFRFAMNVLRIRDLHLELPTGVSRPMVAFRDVYGPKILNLTNLLYQGLLALDKIKIISCSNM